LGKGILMCNRARSRALLAAWPGSWPALLLLAGLLAGLSPAPASAVAIDWVTVDAPGNAADSTGFGAVGATYRIARSEVTNAQYAGFLNAVAATDTFALYNTSMASGLGGITRSGSTGSFSYAPIGGRADLPVNFVSFYDALRFANWLHNGQGSGAQDASTTEDGAYTITAGGIAANSITRNPGAEIFLTSEDEWYKSAYYDAISTSYFLYPFGSDTPTTCAAPGGGANAANCGLAVGDLTAVGSYPGSPSPSGTWDQGGNVREWNESVRFSDFRGVRGGGFGADPGNLASTILLEFLPSHETLDLGFRVASLPEPGSGLLLALGLVGAGLRGRRSRSTA